MGGADFIVALILRPDVVAVFFGFVEAVLFMATSLYAHQPAISKRALLRVNSIGRYCTIFPTLKSASYCAVSLMNADSSKSSA